MIYEFKCPKCGAKPNKCGPKPTEMCRGSDDACMGFVCECDRAYDEYASHGETLGNPCKEANCYHCGWGGVHPKPPKGLQSWEKKALAAGWKMPKAREAELKGNR